MIAAFTSWVINLIVGLWTDVWNFVTDLVIGGVELILNAVVALVSAIPAPQFLTNNSIVSLVNQLPSYVLYFVQSLNITAALAIIAGGFAFRMIRKAVTLGQW